jgi:hypothetical protein
MGGKTIEGSDLACLFIRPRPGDDRACVGVVAGTGLAGLRLTASIPYFRSGTALPDWIVMGSDALEHGISGIRGAGFFDNDWGISAADTAWAEP